MTAPDTPSVDVEFINGTADMPVGSPDWCAGMREANARLRRQVEELTGEVERNKAGWAEAFKCGIAHQEARYAAEARLAVVTEALRPFAKAARYVEDVCAENYHPVPGNEAKAWVSGWERGSSYPMLTYGDFYRARQALASESRDEGQGEGLYVGACVRAPGWPNTLLWISSRDETHAILKDREGCRVMYPLSDLALRPAPTPDTADQAEQSR